MAPARRLVLTTALLGLLAAAADASGAYRRALPSAAPAASAPASIELPFAQYAASKSSESSRYRDAPAPGAVKTMSTEELRENFLIESPFVPGEVSVTYTQHDRMVTGGAMPLAGEAPLPLADTAVGGVKDPFLSHRELAVFNIGGGGKITADGASYDLGYLDAIYLPAGTANVTFESDEAGKPAKFWLAGAPCQASEHLHKPVLIPSSDTDAVPFQASAEANRTLRRYITVGRVPGACQLMCGITLMEPGASWNQSPAHLHPRKSEVYLYFDMAPSTRVIHLMGEPKQTRHLVVANEQVVVSPPWSVHIGTGTGHHAIAWAMAGENRTPEDRYRVAFSDIL